MGIDTRFWGGSGWELFHLVAAKTPNPEKLLGIMKDILPCKFCRQSTRKFIRENPYDPKNPEKWLYEIHNMVNNKLRTQCREDPRVINPGPDPLFSLIRKKYQDMKIVHPPGRDFLMSVAVNFTDNKSKFKQDLQRRFISILGEEYPAAEMREVFSDPDLTNYPKWMYEAFKKTGKSDDLPAYQDYLSKVTKYKSKCKHGKTCRKSRGNKTRRLVGGF